MKIHFITIGRPKLEYARLGWDEYTARLSRLHQLKVGHVPDKYAYDAGKIAEYQAGTYKVVLDIEAKEFSSQDLAKKLVDLEMMSKEISFLIGGPDGLPNEIRQSADMLWSLGKLTLPHDLAMVVALEAIYRASTINANLPYHR